MLFLNRDSLFRQKKVAFFRRLCYNARVRRIRTSVVQQLPKLWRRVRLPYPAPLDANPNTITVVGMVFIQTKRHALPWLAGRVALFIVHSLQNSDTLRATPQWGHGSLTCGKESSFRIVTYPLAKKILSNYREIECLVWKGGEYCLLQGIDESGKIHYTSLKRYHCFGKTAHSRLSLSQFSVADTAGEPFLFSKSGHFRYVLQNLLRRSARMAGMLRLISWGGK